MLTSNHLISMILRYDYYIEYVDLESGMYEG